MQVGRRRLDGFMLRRSVRAIKPVKPHNTSDFIVINRGASSAQHDRPCIRVCTTAERRRLVLITLQAQQH